MAASIQELKEESEQWSEGMVEKDTLIKGLQDKVRVLSALCHLLAVCFLLSFAPAVTRGRRHACQLKKQNLAMPKIGLEPTIINTQVRVLSEESASANECIEQLEEANAKVCLPLAVCCLPFPVCHLLFAVFQLRSPVSRTHTYTLTHLHTYTLTHFHSHRPRKHCRITPR
jgi:hypothetical protein